MIIILHNYNIFSKKEEQALKVNDYYACTAMSNITVIFLTVQFYLNYI